MIKKGAMFGLDARIALAIFGALSVISGAALYSAIQDAKVTALVTELEELSKAVQSYTLDTGKDIPLNPDLNNTNLDMEELINSSANGWKGPYVSYQSHKQYHLDHPRYVEMGILKVSNTGYDDGDYTNKTPVCTSTKCDIYVYINGVPLNIAQKVDLMVDGEAGIDKGRVRLSYGFTGSAESYNTAISYKVMPALSKP
jgi:type II secretory pathway pseudopilin PulG